MQKSIFHLLVLLGSLFLVACTQQTIDGNGKPVSISRTSEPFQALDVRGDYKIIV